MKMQKSAIFVDKSLKINIEKKYWKVRDNYRFIGKYRGNAHITCNLK